MDGGELAEGAVVVVEDELVTMQVVMERLHAEDSHLHFTEEHRVVAFVLNEMAGGVHHRPADPVGLGLHEAGNAHAFVNHPDGILVCEALGVKAPVFKDAAHPMALLFGHAEDGTVVWGLEALNNAGLEPAGHVLLA